jgi:hypothetical protein
MKNMKIFIIDNEDTILKKECTFHTNHYFRSSIKNIGQTKARFLTIELLYLGTFPFLIN